MHRGSLPAVFSLGRIRQAALGIPSESAHPIVLHWLYPLRKHTGGSNMKHSLRVTPFWLRVPAMYKLLQFTNHFMAFGPLSLSLSCRTINGAQESLLLVHLCCNPTKAPCPTLRGHCLVFLASLACSKLLCNSWLTHPLQCGKQVVAPRAEGSRSRTDGFSVTSWGGGGGTAWVLYITLRQQLSGRCYRSL